jgi:beta-1,2-rhamnosyltransferase WsaF-like protein
MSRPTVTERLRQTRRLLTTEGAGGVSARLRKRAAAALAPHGDTRLRVTREDLMRAAEVADAGWVLPGPAPLTAAEPLTIAWVTVPPSESSGGHTTMFRMVTALEAAGHTCVLYLDDQHGWDIEQHRRNIRTWLPSVRAEVRDVRAGIEDAHAVLATSWQTAYPVLASPAKGVRFYCVADFEPSFYPAGSEYLLAEATYRFGFYGVTHGKWLAQMLRRDYGMPADHFDFGCDLQTYRLDRSPGAAARRTGVCYYCRPSTPRRAHELAMATLDLFAARHPEVDIHFYGEPAGRLPFRAVDHGFLKPAQLDALYNRCFAGLALSATNVSLVPHEMMACGCIPVVNDAEHTRMVLDNDHVSYASPTPFELANALSAIVEQSSPETIEAAARSVSGASWADAGAKLERIIRREVMARVDAEIAA